MFYFFEVEDEKVMERIYRFRYEILCEELKFFDKRNYPDGLETDEFDRYANHFVAFDEEFNIAATIRYIHHSPIGYPTLKHLRIYPHLEELLRLYKWDRLGEISRVFVHKRYRNMADTKYIIRKFVTQKIYYRAKDYGVEYNLAALEKRFLRLLHMFDVNFEPIGELQSGYGSPRYPCIVPTERIERDNPEFLKDYLSRRWF